MKCNWLHSGGAGVSELWVGEVRDDRRVRRLARRRHLGHLHLHPTRAASVCQPRAPPQSPLEAATGSGSHLAPPPLPPYRASHSRALGPYIDQFELATLPARQEEPLENLGGKPVFTPHQVRDRTRRSESANRPETGARVPCYSYAAGVGLHVTPRAPAPCRATASPRPAPFPRGAGAWGLGGRWPENKKGRSARAERGWRVRGARRSRSSGWRRSGGARRSRRRGRCARAASTPRRGRYGHPVRLRLYIAAIYFLDNF